jgi:predicted nucleotidyltransferase
MLGNLKSILEMYIEAIHKELGNDFLKAVLYGSCVRNEYTSESDVDIAIFTDISSNEFYILVNKISEITFEFSVKYDLILSPVFINYKEYYRMMKVMPYYQNIQKEGIVIG